MTIKKNIFFTRSGIQQPVMNKLKPMTYFQTKSDFGTFLAIRITVQWQMNFKCSTMSPTPQCLNLILVGSKKVWIPQKWCLTTYINFLGYSIFKFLYLDLFLDFFGGHFWAQKAKNDQKIKIVHFHYFSCWKFFWTQFLSIFFFWMATIYTGKFFILKKKFDLKKRIQFFFQKFSFGPPYGCFFFLWGTKGSCSRFELQQSCICALCFSGR